MSYLRLVFMHSLNQEIEQDPYKYKTVHELERGRHVSYFLYMQICEIW